MAPQKLTLNNCWEQLVAEYFQIVLGCLKGCSLKLLRQPTINLISPLYFFLSLFSASSVFTPILYDHDWRGWHQIHPVWGENTIQNTIFISKYTMPFSYGILGTCLGQKKVKLCKYIKKHVRKIMQLPPHTHPQKQLLLIEAYLQNILSTMNKAFCSFLWL